jgi:hypothetical protein
MPKNSEADFEVLLYSRILQEQGTGEYIFLKLHESWFGSHVPSPEIWLNGEIFSPTAPAVLQYVLGLR